MSWFMVDVEADGPCPGLYSMVEFGCVLVTEDLEEASTFYGQIKPISENYMQEALDVFNATRELTQGYNDPTEVMTKFANWIDAHNSHGRAQFISDNNGFDWQFINYYFWAFTGRNPFGHSSQNLGSIYKGMKKDFFQSFKYLRKTKHTHHPVDDSMGNAEALVHMKKEMGLKVKLK